MFSSDECANWKETFLIVIFRLLYEMLICSCPRVGFIIFVDLLGDPFCDDAKDSEKRSVGQYKGHDIMGNIMTIYSYLSNPTIMNVQ
jgi:hypothetical protein